MKRFSGKISNKLELINKAMHHHDLYQEIVGKIVNEFAEQTGKKSVLEIGCGSGLTTRQLAKNNVKMTAVDNEPKLLRQAPSLRNVIYVEADALDYLKKAVQFDIIVSVFTYHNMTPEYRKEIFKKSFDSLSKGGLWITADKIAYPQTYKKDMKWQMEQFKVYDKIQRPDLRRAWEKHYIEDEKFIIFENELKKFLAEIGFIDIQRIRKDHMEMIFCARKP